MSLPAPNQQHEHSELFIKHLTHITEHIYGVATVFIKLPPTSDIVLKWEILKGYRPEDYFCVILYQVCILRFVQCAGFTTSHRINSIPLSSELGL